MCELMRVCVIYIYVCVYNFVNEWLLFKYRNILAITFPSLIYYCIIMTLLTVIVPFLFNVFSSYVHLFECVLSVQGIL